MQFRKNNQEKVTFTANLAVELIKRKLQNIKERKIMSVVNYVRIYLLEREDCKIN